MGTVNKNILAVNGGSSSIKFALYAVDGSLSPRLSGKIERIGLPDAGLTFTDSANRQEEHLPVQAGGMKEAADFLLDFLQKHEGAVPLLAIGHRIVHGLGHREPIVIDEALLAELFMRRCPGLRSCCPFPGVMTRQACNVMAFMGCPILISSKS
jgi:acetate kinase